MCDKNIFKQLVTLIVSFSIYLYVVQGRPFQCTECPAAFCRKPYLSIHYRIHSGEKPCERSESIQRDSWNFMQFLISVTCEVCSKSFTQKSSLNIHTRIHTGAVGIFSIMRLQIWRLSFDVTFTNFVLFIHYQASSHTPAIFVIKLFRWKVMWRRIAGHTSPKSR